MLGVDLGVVARSPWPLIAAATLFGSAIYAQYLLCVAHANDFVDREEFVEASSGLLLTWAIGASIGPLLAAFAMDAWGVGGLFMYTALVHATFVLFAVYRMRRRTALPPEARAPYVVGGRPARTTPIAIELDPRAPEPPDDADQSRAA